MLDFRIVSICDYKTKLLGVPFTYYELGFFLRRVYLPNLHAVDIIVTPVFVNAADIIDLLQLCNY